MDPLLQIQSLSLSYHQKNGETRALRDINLTVEKGQSDNALMHAFEYLHIPQLQLSAPADL